MSEIKRLRLMDEYGNVIIYDIGAGSITFDDRNMTLPQVIAMLEAAIEVAGQVKTVTMNGTKIEPNEETGDINLGTVLTEHQDISGKANKDELTVTNGSSADKKVIQLKDGTSVEVIIEHQDISGKVDKEQGKGLSSEDFTAALKSKLEGIAAGAEVNPAIVNGLSETISGKVLDATQGKELKDLIDALQTALAGKQATLTFDDTPTDGSDNPVTSDGVFEALKDLLSNITIDETTGNWFVGTTDTGVKAQGPKGNSVVDGDTFDIVNNLTEGGEGDALSAEMGKTLKQMIDDGIASIYTENTDVADLDFQDEDENVVLRIGDGHIKTANFDSMKLPSDTFAIPNFVGTPQAYLEEVSTSGLSLWNTGSVSTVYNAYDALASEYPDWLIRQTNIGKDASNVYDMAYYTLRYRYPSVNSLRTDAGTEYWSDTTFPMRRLLIVAGVHPDEKWSVYGCYIAVKAILESDEPWAVFIKSNFILDIVPLANPWGWVNNSSTNSNGKNLNRTYFDNKQAENNAIISLIQTLKTKGLVGIIDCHNTGSPNQYDLGYGYLVAKPSYKHWTYLCTIAQQIAAVVRPMTKGVFPSSVTGSHFYAWDATGNNGQLHHYADSQGLLGATFEVAEAAGLKGCVLTKAILINLINSFGTYIGQ